MCATVYRAVSPIKYAIITEKLTISFLGIERGIRAIMGGFAGQATHSHYEATPPTTSRAIQAIGRSMAITFSQGEPMNVSSNPVNMPVQAQEPIPESDVTGLAQPIVKPTILPIEDGDSHQHSNEEGESENGAPQSQESKSIS